MSSCTSTRVVLDAGPSAARVARSLVREHLVASGVDDEGVLDRVVLVVSELVTNAVRHAGRAPVLLRVDIDHHAVQLGVADGSTREPSVVDPYEGGGRGMVVIATLASRWWTAPREDGEPGKVVWARFDLGAGSTGSAGSA